MQLQNPAVQVPPEAVDSLYFPMCETCQHILQNRETSQQLKICAGYMYIYIYAMHDFNRLMSAMSIDGIWQNNLITLFLR
eukprot:COSAG05_NODE_1597_length_4454_cov_228.028932_1_plen_79_part_10